MFNKTTLVLAASAFLMAACGGGGGGSGGGTPAATPGPTLDTAAQAAAQGTTVNDAVAIVAGAQLLLDYETSPGVSHQFGGRVNGTSSGTSTSQDISCGVYELASAGSTTSTAFATPTSTNYAVLCTVLQATSGNTKYRHYIKISSAGGVAPARNFNVAMWADRYVSSPSTVLAFLPQANATLSTVVTVNDITHYDLDGALPQTYLPATTTGDFINAAGQTTVDLSGAVSKVGSTTTIGYVGPVKILKSDASAAGWDKTYASTAKVTYVTASGNLGSVNLVP